MWCNHPKQWEQIMRSYTHYDEQLQFRGPVGLTAAVAAAAQREHTAMSEFLRRTVLARLAEIGIPLQPNEGKTGAA
jgi:hypothetical protein